MNLTKYNGNIHKLYKTIIKQITRLPLDRLTLNRLVNNTKNNFIKSKTRFFKKKAYQEKLKLFNEVLEYEQYLKIHQILDLVYHPRGTPDWMKKAENLKYNEMDFFFPEIHLNDEIRVDLDQSKKYHEEIKQSLNEEISMVDQMDGDKERIEDFGLENPGFPMLIGYETEETQRIVSKMFEFHNFLKKNNSLLSKNTIKHLPVIHSMTLFGHPNPASTRIKKKKKQMFYLKQLMQKFRPILKSDLEHLIAVSQSQNEVEGPLKINDFFFKYMIRKKRKEDGQKFPLMKKLINERTTIPTKFNIRKIYRLYYLKTFFYDENDSPQMCWIENYYSNKKSIFF